MADSVLDPFLQWYNGGAPSVDSPGPVMAPSQDATAVDPNVEMLPLPQPDAGAQFANALTGQPTPAPVDPGIEMLPPNEQQPPLPPDISPEQSAAPPQLPPWITGVVDTAKGVANAITGNGQQQDPWASQPATPPPLGESDIDKMSDADKMAFAQRHPQEWRDYNLHKDMAQQTELLKQKQELDLEKATSDYEEAKRHRKALADADTKRQALFDEASKLSADGGYWANRSSFGKVVDVLSAAIGGLIQGRTGSANNMGLDIINQNINRSIEAERARINMKGSILNQMTAQLGDQHAAEEALRQASYQVAGQKMMSEAMNREQGGTQQRAFINAKLGLDAAAAKSAQDYTDAQYKQNLANAKTIADIELSQANAGKAKLEALAQAQKLQGGGGGAAKTVYVPSEADYQNATPPPAFLAAGGTPKGWLELRNTYLTGKGKEQDVAAGGPLGTEERKNALERGMGLVDYKDGKPVEFIARGGAESVDKLREKLGAAENVVRALDDVLDIKSKEGGSSDYVNSEANQKLKTLYGNNFVHFKDAVGLKAITETDAPAFNAAIGARDGEYTSWREITGRIEEARRLLLRGMRINLRRAGMSDAGVQHFDLTNLYKLPAKESPVEERIRKGEEWDRQHMPGGKVSPRDPVTGEIKFGPGPKFE